MKEALQIDALLNELGFAFEHEQLEEDLIHYEITVDAGEQLTVTAFLYNTPDGVYFRLQAYVDELSEDGPLEQLSKVLALNGDLPTGAFCLDQEENLIYVTVNMPALEITPDMLSWVIEFLFVAQEVYYQEFYPVEPENLAD
jgi:hypothetical protein